MSLKHQLAAYRASAKRDQEVRIDSEDRIATLRQANLDFQAEKISREEWLQIHKLIMGEDWEPSAQDQIGGEKTHGLRTVDDSRW